MSGPAVPPYRAYADRPAVEQQYASGALERPEGGDLPSESFGRLFAEPKRDARKRETMRQYLIYGGMAIAVVAVIVAVVYAASRFRRPL